MTGEHEQHLLRDINLILHSTCLRAGWLLSELLVGTQSKIVSPFILLVGSPKLRVPPYQTAL